jgi:hypothetical protein
VQREVVAIDGAFLRANASKSRLIMKKGAKRELKKVEESIEEYFTALEYSDSEPSSATPVSKLPRDLEKLQTKKQKLESDIALPETLTKEQYNRTDPDATLMSKPAHNLMACNSRIAVDGKYKFIVATDVTSEGSDKQELYHDGEAGSKKRRQRCRDAPRRQGLLLRGGDQEMP